MKATYWIGILIALVLLASTAFAYQGFNRFYYTNNYTQSVYYPSPTYGSYYYPSYAYTNSYYAPTVVYPSYYYPTTYYYPRAYAYTYPAYGAYTGVGFYTNGDAWGFSIGRGSVCGYYGYC